MTQNDIVTDIIAILDESASMHGMGDEPVDSVNVFFEEQKKTQNDLATATLVTFNTHSRTIIDNKKLSELKKIQQHDYNPKGGTAINDAICSTIKSRLSSSKPNNVVLVIITDGQENSSQYYSIEDTREMINLVEEKHSWKVIFIGANIDVLSEGCKMNINADRCMQYEQMVPGDLLSSCRTASYHVDDYRRSRSGGNNVELKMPKLSQSYSVPIGDKEKTKISNEILGPTPLTRTKKNFAQPPSIIQVGQYNTTLPDGSVLWI